MEDCLLHVCKSKRSVDIELFTHLQRANFFSITNSLPKRSGIFALVPKNTFQSCWFWLSWKVCEGWQNSFFACRKKEKCLFLIRRCFRKFAITFPCRYLWWLQDLQFGVQGGRSWRSRRCWEKVLVKIYTDSPTAENGRGLVLQAGWDKNA